MVVAFIFSWNWVQFYFPNYEWWLEEKDSNSGFDSSGKDSESPPRNHNRLAERRGWGSAEHGDRAASVHGADSAGHGHQQPAAVQHCQRPGAERTDHQPGSEWPQAGSE